jgi:hypothetical protein
MQFKVGRTLHFYYLSILVITLAGFSVGVKYFWDNGPFNSDNMNATYEASIHFDELKKRNPIKGVELLVEADRSRDAVTKLTSLEKRTQILSRQYSLDSFNNFRVSLKQSKGLLNELISYPQMANVILVLSNKVSSFESFVVQNRWRTLSRISKRAKARMTGRALQSPGFYSSSKLSSLYRLTVKDIENMEQVTKNSVLAAGDKQVILTKLETLNTELSMLKRYIASLDNFQGSYKTLSKRYSTWFQELAPEIALNEITREQKSKTLAFGFLGMGAFLLLGLIGGIFLHKKTTVAATKRWEGQALKLFQDGLIPLENRVNMNGASSEFIQEFERCREYFHKRISFGSVFQEAVPFSSILLDSNLNVSWANDLFYEHWSVEDTHHNGGSVSWDYLQQFTNLGEDDPVLMAHNQGIAGIYQIQVRRDDSSERLPYEMYVSPVEYSGQKRIMIFFYPLRSLEETIANQTKSIVGPIGNTLEAFMQDRFDLKMKEKLSKDFEVAGIGELFEKLISFRGRIEDRNNEYLAEINNLERSLEEQMDLVSDLEAFSMRKQNLSNDIKSDFESSKNAIVHIIDLRYELESLFNNAQNLTRNLIKQEAALLVGSEKATEVIQENLKAFASVNDTKNEFKDFRNSIDELRARLNQSLEQTMVFMKKEGLDPKLESSISRIRLEMKGVDKALQGFAKVTRKLDVGLSKMEMIVERSDLPDNTKCVDTLTKIKQDLDNSTFEFGRITRSGQKTDDLVVDSLKNLFNSFSLMNDFDKNSAALIESYREEEMQQNVVFVEDVQVQPNSLDQQDRSNLGHEV